MMRDPGTLWHTVAGERMLTEHRIIREDPFSFTQGGDEWIAQQWLAEVIMAFVHRAAGLDGLLTLACVIIAAIFGILAGRAERIGLPWPISVVFLLIIAAAGSYHFMPRPHLVTLLIMTVGTTLLCDVEAGRASPKWLLTIPPVMVLWSNLHGGALGGIASLLVIGFIYLIRLQFHDCDRTRDLLLHDRVENPNRSHFIFLALAVGGSIPAVMINPYGAALPRVWISLMDSEVLPRVIIEHARTRLFSIEGMFILAIGGAYAATLVCVHRRCAGRTYRTTWLLPAVWFLLALSRIRHAPIFAIVAAVVILDMLPHTGLTALRPIHATISAPRGRTRFSRWVASGIVVLAFTLKSTGAPLPVIGARWCRLDPNYWPIDATAVLQRHLSDTGRTDGIRVFNDMRFAGYLIYCEPRARVFIDDRCELYRDIGLLRYVELQRHPEQIEGEAAYRDIDFAMVRSRSPQHSYLARSSRWTLLHQDRTAVLFGRVERLVAGR